LSEGLVDNLNQLIGLLQSKNRETDSGVEVI